MNALAQAKVLVVDDDERKQQAIAGILVGLPLTIEMARSGRDALRKLLAAEYAAILLDVRMPGMDGIETARLIRGRDQFKSLPIIFVSSYSSDEVDLLEGYSLGAVDFIFSPIVPEILRAKVSVFIDLYDKTQTIKEYGRQLETLVGQRTADLTTEIAKHVQTQEQLWHLAHHDVLTELPNRLLFVDRLNQALSRICRRNLLLAVMFLDTDRFKLVNDTLGHLAGDALLRGIADRLRGLTRHGDTVGRFGGDEFSILLDDIASVDDVAPLATKILSAFESPFEIAGRKLFITGSIGISLYPADGSDADALLKNADTAMYQAKQQGGNSFQFYQYSMQVHALERLELETQLRHALDRHEFVLHYQPQLDLSKGQITGFEALIRWNKPGYRLVLPGEFISVLEETGLIGPVGEWAIRTACEQHRAWCSAGMPPVRIAVNISGRQFDQNDFGKKVLNIVIESGCAPEFLEIEITESTLMKNAQLAVNQLREMSAAGIRLAIDDFGTGYSSLGHLKQFPIDVLKIDRTFVRDILTDSNDAAIVEAIITLAHTLNMDVIAEGVETRGQLEFLQARGCDVVQGYFIGRPLEAERVQPSCNMGDDAQCSV